MKFQIKAQLAVHLLKRIIDGNKNAIYLTVCICLAIHLEHLSKCRVGVCTGAMPEFVSVRGDVVVESYKLHIVLKQIHHFLQVVRVA